MVGSQKLKVRTYKEVRSGIKMRAGRKNSKVKVGSRKYEMRMWFIRKRKSVVKMYV